MSQWGGQPPAAGPGTVTFFDPSKFQTNAQPAQQPVQQPVQQPNIAQPHQVPAQQPHAEQPPGQPGQVQQDNDAWNTWGAWDPGANPYASEFVPVSKDQGPVPAVNNDYQNAGASQQQPDPLGQNQTPQWYAQNNWNHDAGQTATQQHNHVQPAQADANAQWDPNAQGQWDPNNQQMVQNPYNYNEYNNYWAGQNGSYNAAQNGNYTGEQNVYEAGDGNHGMTQQPASTGMSQQPASTGNYFVQDPNLDPQFAVSQNHDPNLVPASASDNIQVPQPQNNLNISASTESGSANQSVGNIEEGADYNDDDDYETEETGSEEEESEEENESVSNINTNSLTGGGASYFATESEQEPVSSVSNEHIQSQNTSSDYENVGGNVGDVNAQMQALNIQDHHDNVVVSHAGTEHGYNYGYSNVAGSSYGNQYETNVQPSAMSNVPAQHSHTGGAPITESAVPSVPLVPVQPPAQGQEGALSWPPPVKSSSADDDNPQPTGVNATPTFSDWEIVPSTGSQTTHSRTASVDNNVDFYIGSASSSARVSPASSSKSKDDRLTGPSTDHSDAVHRTNALAPVQAMNYTNNKTGPPHIEAPPQQHQGPPKSHGPPPLPVITGGMSSEGNQYRKPPTGKQALLGNSGNDASLLSSTHLDITRPDSDNSPVILGPSISPIMPVEANQNQAIVNPSGEITDTPVSKKTRQNSGNVKQSPIMHRKESPFQPPKHDSQRIKPMKASHDIPGLPEHERRSETGKAGPEKKERRTPDMEGERRSADWDSRGERRNEKGGQSGNERGGYDRRTPDLDSKSNRRGEGSERNYDRRTPDMDSRERRNGRRTPDRDSRYRDGGRGDRDRPPRQRQSAFHHIQTNRTKNNVSPAASLLDIADCAPSMSNILLVPASGTSATTAGVGSGSTTATNNPVSAPSELKPVASLITSLSEQIKTEDGDNEGKGQGHSKNRNDLDKDRDPRDRDPRDRYRDRDSDRSRYRDKDRDREKDRDELRGNRSYESLRDRNLKDSRNNSRERMSMYGSRDSLDAADDSRLRGRRGDSRDRDRSYRDEYYDKYRDRDRDRPPSRSSILDTSSRRDYRDRDRDYYRRDRERDRDRPKSRQGERERPGSRGGESERPRSRAEYEREYRDRYRAGGYSDYDDYYRRTGGTAAGYYDRQYYDYYYGNYGQQAGYYDEHGYYHQPDSGRFEYPPDLYDYSRTGYEDYYGYEQNGYRWDPNVSEWVATTTEVIPQRQTPEKFVIPHVRACFGPGGQLLKVLPNRPVDGQPATIEIHDVQVILEENEESEQLNEFPGPLIRGDTHKNDVLLFCQNKARHCTENMNLEDRESAELIWRFLELLIKQNGTVVGTDIADLLLQGHEPTTQEYRRTGMKITPSSNDFLDVPDDESEDSQRLSRGTTPVDRSGTTPVDRSMINRGKSIEEVTDRFRHLLMFGRKKDALDWSMKNNLWGHALFLASKMDTRAHANVMTRFANVAMRMNDPLQTLYQLMSGRQPAAVTCVTEERWGDWRPHLAMVLSNTSAKPELDRKSITTLGDTLASRGFLHASHFCYLMARTSFGSYNKKSSKLVLIGSSHALPLEYFANDEAIQCTEIYEYALALGNSLVALTNFQTYKFMYMTKLIDYGYAQIALRYCEVIARQINANPAFYQHILVKLVYDLSSQLKFSDPSLEDDEDQQQDPDWLRGLHTTLVQFEEGAIQPMSGSATPALFGGRTAASSESGEVGMYMQTTDNTQVIPQEGFYGASNINDMYSIHEQSQQYQDQTQMYPNSQGFDNTQLTDPSYTQGATVPGQETATAAGYQTGADNQYQQQPDNSYVQQTNDGQHAQWSQQHANLANQNSGGFESTNQGEAHAETANQMPGYGSHDPNTAATQYQPYDPNQAIWAQHGQHQYNHQPPRLPGDVNLADSQTSGVSSTQSAKRSSLASTSSVPSDIPEEGDDLVDSSSIPGSGQNNQASLAHQTQQPSIFDLHQQQPGRIIAPKMRPRTTSESSAGSTGCRDRHPSGGQGNKSVSHTSSSSKDSLDPSKQGKAAAGGGLFSKIGGFFSRKNEMKLPDDKEPSIVWDPVKQRWVDKDAGEVEETPTAPPPKDNELHGSVSQPVIQAPAGPGFGMAPSASSNDMPPPAGGNKFSRRKGIGARSQYVDVLNPKSAGSSSNVPSALFSTLPNSHSAPAIFNPMGGASESSASDPASQGMPEERRDSGADNSNPPQSTPSNSHLPPLSENTTEPAPSASQAPPTAAGGPPTMFNPAQFQQNNQTFKQPAPPGPGHRLSNRRVYPK